MVTLFNVPVKRIFVVALVVLMGCKDADKNSSLIFEDLNESLEQSNKLVAKSSGVILESLKSKVDDPASRGIAIKWLLLADSISSKSKYLIEFIDSLKSNLKQNKIQIGQLTSNDLFKKLIVFKEFITDKNLNYKIGYNDDIHILSNHVRNDTSFYEAYFFKNNAAAINAVLSKLENSIAITTNKMMSFCHGQVTGFSRTCEMIQPIAIINSTKFSQGEELVINAGIGAFKLMDKLSFEINGVNVQPNGNGVGEYKMKIKKRPGNYKAHVKIRYTTPDGRNETLEKDIGYTVVE